VYDLAAAPWSNNAGNFSYNNMDEYSAPGVFGGPSFVPTFIGYVEGIYVGYRFYETAAEWVRPFLFYLLPIHGRFTYRQPGEYRL
jgi:hypothetical protein